MKSNKNISSLIEVSQGIFLVIALALTIISFTSSLGIIYKVLSTTQTVFSFLAEGYVLFLWKIPFLNFLGIPNIAGKYKVNISSTYHGANVKPATLSITQHFLDIDVALFTEDKESNSFSIGGARFIENGGQKSLVYYYFSSPNAKYRNKNPDKRGTAIYDIKDGKLSDGEYWTDKQTMGSISIVSKL